jgi:hypothetical protein
MMPFDIDVPYRMRPNMRPLGENEPITYQDKDAEYYLIEKMRIVAQAYGNNWNPYLYKKILDYLQCQNMIQAILKYQEDFVVWAPDVNGKLSIQMASVCFPSGWDPVSKVNKSFAEIHEPVADNKTIMAASDHIAKMITEKGPFVRSVWSIHNSPDLNRHPSVKKPWTNEGLESMWYRAERQVTVPLGDCAIFFIRTYVVPLLSVDIKRIRESIQSMTDEILTYKDLHFVKDALHLAENWDSYSDLPNPASYEVT